MLIKHLFTAISQGQLWNTCFPFSLVSLFSCTLNLHVLHSQIHLSILSWGVSDHFFSKTSHLPQPISWVPPCLLKLSMAKIQRCHLFQMLHAFSRLIHISASRLLLKSVNQATPSAQILSLHLHSLVLLLRRAAFCNFFPPPKKWVYFPCEKWRHQGCVCVILPLLSGFSGGVLPTFYVCAIEPTEIHHHNQIIY